jgi:hypothetical protein
MVKPTMISIGEQDVIYNKPLMTQEYTVDSMIHLAKANIRGLKKICEETSAGYEFSSENSDCTITISGGSENEKKAWTMMIYGGTSTEQIECDIKNLKKRVENSGGEFEQTVPPKITNIAVSGELGYDTLNLENLSIQLNQKGLDFEYEPEQFPALYIYMSEPDCTFLLFSTGSYSIQGLRDIDEIPEALDKLERLLEAAIDV